MSRLEKFSERRFCRDIERLGGQALKQDGANNAGIPDRLCWLPSPRGPVWFFVEWKRVGETARKHQAAYHRKLRRAGHIVIVCDNNDFALNTAKLIAQGKYHAD